MTMRLTFAAALATLALAAQPAPAPALGLSLNGKSGAEIRSGWPLLVELSVQHSEWEEGARKLQLPAREGSWTGAVTIEVRNEAGEEVKVGFVPHQPVEERLELEAGEQATVYWSLSPEVTTDLPEGTYAVRAVLDTGTLAVGDEWNGRLATDWAALRISKPAAEPSVEERAAQLKLRADLAALQKAWAEGLGYVDEWIGLQPENPQPYATRGELLDRAERPAEALRALNRAIELMKAQQESSGDKVRESYGSLELRQKTVLFKMLGQ